MTNAISSQLDLTVGPYSFSQEDDDMQDPDYGAPFVVDGLTLQTQLGDDQLWPMQGTGQVSFSVFGPTVDDVIGIVRGALVLVDWYAPRTGGTARVTFKGRVTDAKIKAHPLGVIVDIVALDLFTTDFDVVVGDTPWPQEEIPDRLDRIVALLGATLTHSYNPVAPGAAALTRPVVKARDVDAQPALALVRGYLSSWVLDYTGILKSQGFLDPNVDYPEGTGYGTVLIRPKTIVGQLVTEWEAVVRFAAFSSGATLMGVLPGVFGDTTADGAPGYGVTVPDHGVDRSDATLSADYVDLSGTVWTQRKGNLPNRVYVSYWNGAVEASVSRSNGLTPVVAARLSTDLIGTIAATCAARVAALYLPIAESGDWYADAFHWRMYADDDTQRTVGRVGDLITITPIQERHNPTGRPWYSGLVVGVVFQLTGAAPVVDLTITPQQRRVLSQVADMLSWDDVPSGVTWADLNTRDTWNDYQLLREL